MGEFGFSEEVLARIRHDRYHHPHPRVQRKMEVLWLKSLGLTHADIAEFADVSPRSVQRYLEHPPRSAREAQQAIERLTGVRRGLSRVRSFLKKSWPGLAQGRHSPGGG
jgi:hypothetical protein